MEAMLALYINMNLNILLVTGTCILIYTYMHIGMLVTLSGLKHGQHTVSTLFSRSALSLISLVY